VVNRHNGKPDKLEDILDILPDHQREWEQLVVQSSVRSRLLGIRMLRPGVVRAALHAATARRRYMEGFLKLKQIWNK